jgi:hypothetical protein
MLFGYFVGQALIFFFQVVHRRLQDIKRNREEQQRKLPISIYNEEDKIFQSPTKSHKKLVDFYISL